MTILQMECFINAAKFQSYSMAAANLYISQPTLSRQIQALEDELNVVLFNRTNNKMHLTAVGEQMRPKIEALFQNFQITSECLKGIADNYSGRLRIGIQSGNSLDHRVRQTCQYIEGRHPEASIIACHQTQRGAYNSLMEERVDLLMALNITMPPSDKLDSLILHQEYMCLAVPYNHRNANLPSVSPTELGQFFPDLKLYCIDNREFEIPLEPLDHRTAEQAVMRTVYLTGSYADPDTIMMMVDAGLGMAYVHSRNILSTNQKVKLIPLAVPSSEGEEATRLEMNPLSVRLYWLRQNRNPILNEFLSYLKAVL